jgi:hypothetical protein
MHSYFAHPIPSRREPPPPPVCYGRPRGKAQQVACWFCFACRFDLSDPGREGSRTGRVRETPMALPRIPTVYIYVPLPIIVVPPVPVPVLLSTATPFPVSLFFLLISGPTDGFGSSHLPLAPMHCTIGPSHARIASPPQSPRGPGAFEDVNVRWGAVPVRWCPFAFLFPQARVLVRLRLFLALSSPSVLLSLSLLCRPVSSELAGHRALPLSRSHLCPAVLLTKSGVREVDERDPVS